MASQKNSQPKKRKGATHDPTQDAMILMDYARIQRPRQVAQKYGVHHSYVSRLWAKLSESEQKSYLSNAEDIKEVVKERICEREIDWVNKTTDTLKDLAEKTLEEYKKRLTESPDDIPTKELINFTRLTINTVSTPAPKDDDKDNTPANALFNILDNSISINIGESTKNKTNG